ncbi:hypothetical protein OG226_01045 [Streptomyces sp. NBC_01261]|uniref:hypothetical protein n=1 Tax=Streptomyces sp. NBC_01261 TaxID=2903802 RepID=UPI002E30E6C4|nr:hypothetical protein [Streptomyces sp. NBC_01261]
MRNPLSPYPQHLLIATKVGLVRPGPGQSMPLGSPYYLRACVEASLRRLRIERLELCLPAPTPRPHSTTNSPS